MLFQLRAERQAERAQLVANFAARSRGRGMASLDKGLRPEPLGQIPDIRVRAARATREVHFADQEAALQFHQRAFGRQLLQCAAQSCAAPEFTC